MVEASLAEDKKSQDLDRSAILLMLAYVEAECRRMGSETAAHHAAIAAALVGGHAGEAAGAHGEAQDLISSPVH